MKLDVELLEITKDNFAEAQFMSANIEDEALKNRIFLNVAGAEAVSNHLSKFGMNISGNNNIHSMKRVIYKVDIADIILPNVHVDVRVIFDDQRIFIPKSHSVLGIVPDVYIVLKYVNSTERIYLLGFFEPSAVKYDSEDDDYYFIDSSKLRSPFELIEFLRDYNHETNTKLTQEQILRGRELSVKVSDHDITNQEFKEFLCLLLKSNVLRASVLEYDNFESLATKVADALRVKISKNNPTANIVDLDEFMNLNAPEDSHDLSNQDDINGDSLLDGDSLQNSNGFEGQNILDELDDQADILNMEQEEEQDSNSNILDADLQTQSNSLLDEEFDTEFKEGVSEITPETFEVSAADKNDSKAIDIDIQERDEEFTMPEEFETEESDSKEVDTSVISEVNNEVTENSSFTMDEDMFTLNNMDIDFSNFEEDMSDQAADNFIDNDSTTEVSLERAFSEENNNTDSENLTKETELLTVHGQSDTEEEDIVKMEDNQENLADISIQQGNKDIWDLSGDIQLPGFNIDDKELSVISDKNLDTNIKDFNNIREINEMNDSSDRVNTIPEFSNENLVDFSDLSDMTTTSAEVNMEENLHNTGEHLSNVMSKEGVEINRVNDSNVNVDDDFQVEGLLSFEHDNDMNDVVDIALKEQDDADKEELPEDNSAESEPIPEKAAAEEEGREEDNNIDEAQTKDDIFENSEISFDEFSDMPQFEPTDSMEQNIEIDFSENEIADNITEVDSALSQTGVSENSVVITDKNSTFGEIFIDINKENSKPEIDDNEHLEELYTFGDNEDSGLNNGVRIVPPKAKSPVPLIAGIGGLAALLVVAGIIIFFVAKYVNPATKNADVAQPDKKEEQNNLGTDVPKTQGIAGENTNVVMNDDKNSNKNKEAENVNANSSAKTNQKQGTTAKIPSTAFLSVSKLTWEVPDYVSYNDEFKQYFQSSGKSIKAALTSDLLLATDYTYSDQIRVSVSFDKSGNFRDAKILLSSGSSQVDKIVLQSVNQTLKVLKAPNSLGNDDNTTVILKIYL